jgi:hypothetical protein
MSLRKTIVWLVLGLLGGLAASPSSSASSSDAYVCQSIREPIILDGRLTERAWREAPCLVLDGGADAYSRYLSATARLVWDDTGLYVGCEFSDPDLRASWALTEGQASRGLKEAVFGPEAADTLFESMAWRYERHARLTLSPSPGHELEWRWTPLGFSSQQWRERSAGEADGGAAWAVHPDWSCFGMRQAVFLDGTLNNATDVDGGWSLEVFLPWSALAPFAAGNRPPQDGEEWGLGLGRGHREDFGSELIVFQWPAAAPAGRVVFREQRRRFERFFSWGLPADDPGVRKAAEVGFTDATVNWKNAAQIALAKKYGIRTYAIITPTGGRWPAPETPENPRPWQKMTEQEQACWQELWGRKADRQDVLGKVRNEGARGVDPTHWGGEPMVGLHGVEPGRDVLGTRLPCLGSPELRAALKATLAEMCAVPELDGIAFDFFGFQNFRGCYCESCLAGLASAVKAGEVAAGPAGEAEFYLRQILDINRELVAFVRATRPGMLVMSHLYPVFLPRPLYGELLPFDACGETVAWYIPWDVSKIYRYTKQVSSSAGGIPFLGYYDSLRSPAFPYKSGARLRLELQAILDAGGRDIMICSGVHLLSCPEAMEAFRAFTAPNRTGQAAEAGGR